MEDIIRWLIGDMDYNEGVDILRKYSNNKALISTFINGSQKYYQKKLEYEIKLILGIPKNKLFVQKCSNQQLINDCLNKKIETIKPVIKPKIQSKPVKVEIPPIIQEAKSMIVDLWNEISIIHNALFDTGEFNTPDIMLKRKNLLSKRLPLIEKYNLLYNLKEEFFITGKIPKELENALKTGDFIREEKKCNFNLLSDIKLVTLKNRIAANISKYRNKLNFQSIKRQDVLNPMPEGPKKKEVEKKIKSLKSDYSTILKIIEKRNAS